MVWLSEEINATGSGGGAVGTSTSGVFGAEALDATLTVKSTRQKANTDANIRRIRSIDLSRLEGRWNLNEDVYRTRNARLFPQF